MSDEMNPEILDAPVEMHDSEEVVTVNYSEKTLAELADMFMELARNPERMKMNKEAEAIKSAFYKNLAKEKAAAGISGEEVAREDVSVQDSGEEEHGETVSAQETVAEDAVAGSETVSENPFAEIERGFKALYNAYRKERAEYNRQQEKEREHNLELKGAVIEDLKALLEKQEDVNKTFPEFREIQDRWRAIGPVPVQSFRDLNDT